MDYAAYGRHIKEGIELAQTRLEKRGVRIGVIYEDACLAVQALSAVNKLVHSDKIDALVASYCVVGILPAVAALKAAEVVSFHTTVVPQALLDAGDFLFTTNTRIRDEANKLAEYAYGELGLKKTALLYLTTQWGEEYKSSFAERFTALGGTIAGEAANPIGVSDFRTELTSLKRRNPDSIFAVHVGPTLGGVLKQARALGMKQRFLTVNEAEERGVVDLAGVAAEGLAFFAPEPATRTAEMQSFDQEFEGRYGRNAHALARHAFDATLLAATALLSCKQVRSCAKDEIYKTRNYSGASGVFSIEKDGGTRREFVLKSIKNGRFRREK